MHENLQSQRSLTIVAAVYGVLGVTLMYVGDVRGGLLTVTFGIWLMYLKDDPELGFALSLIMLGIDIGVLNWQLWPNFLSLRLPVAVVLVGKAVLMAVLAVLYAVHRLESRRVKASVVARRSLE